MHALIRMYVSVHTCSAEYFPHLSKILPRRRKVGECELRALIRQCCEKNYYRYCGQIGFHLIRYYHRVE